MFTLPAELMKRIIVFRPLFTQPVWEHAKVLLIGAILALGKRTVTACLRVIGLGQEEHFQNYHRVLNRAQWNPLAVSKIFFGMLVHLILADGPVIISSDDTIERRGGRKIRELGYYRDPVASDRKHIVRCFGLKWLVMAVMVPVPWSSRVWALPFLTALCRPVKKGQQPKLWHTRRRKENRKQQARRAKVRTQAASLIGSTARQHKSAVDRTMILIRLLHRWLPQRLVVLVGDGSYAAVKLALVCAGTPNLALVTRLRWDAALYHPPSKQPLGKPGPKPLKGARQRSLPLWARRRDTPWEQIKVKWYGGKQRQMQVFSRTALWHTEAEVPVAIRYVLVRDPAREFRDQVLMTTKLDATPAQIIEWYVMRWSLEVTFEEAREHLGMETQRQWSDLAIARTTPCLLGLFSLVTLLTYDLRTDGEVPIQTTAWYEKSEPTFSDCLFLVRKHLWRSLEYTDSPPKAKSVNLPVAVWEHALSCLAAAT